MLRVMRLQRGSMEKTNQLAIYGKSGHGKVVADIAKLNGFMDILWIDDDPSLKECLSFEAFLAASSHLPVALGIGDNRLRQAVTQKLQQYNIAIETLIHPTASVSPSAKIGTGSVIMPHATVNADTVLGDGAIVNSNAVIEHDCMIGAYTHVSPGCSLAGGVSVGTLTHIGIGASVIQEITIGKSVTLGAGSVVISDLPSNATAVGVPAKVIKR